MRLHREDRDRETEATAQRATTEAQSVYFRRVLVDEHGLDVPPPQARCRMYHAPVPPPLAALRTLLTTIPLLTMIDQPRQRMDAGMIAAADAHLRAFAVTAQVALPAGHPSRATPCFRALETHTLDHRVPPRAVLRPGGTGRGILEQPNRRPPSCIARTLFARRCGHHRPRAAACRRPRRRRGASPAAAHADLGRRVTTGECNATAATTNQAVVRGSVSN